MLHKRHLVLCLTFWVQFTTAQGGVRRYNYVLHDANVATRELALCVWFCVGYKAKADVRRYNIFLIYASYDAKKYIIRIF